jgi:hypothetical protein
MSTVVHVLRPMSSRVEELFGRGQNDPRARALAT